MTPPQATGDQFDELMLRNKIIVSLIYRLFKNLKFHLIMLLTSFEVRVEKGEVRLIIPILSFLTSSQPEV
jgi:hypothetical protein